LVDVGLSLELDDCDDDDELTQGMDLDVGILLTSLPAPPSRDGGDASALSSSDSTRSDPAEAEREIGDGALSLGALREVLLPEEHALGERAQDDDEVGDHEHFPAFESSPVLRPAAPRTERDGSEDDGSKGEA